MKITVSDTARVMSKAILLGIKLGLSYGITIETEFWQSKGGCAGKAYYTKGLVKYNLNYLCSISDREVEELVSHEVAHIVAYRLKGEAGHGGWWRYYHQQMGGRGVRCHKYRRVRVAVCED